MSKAKHWCFTLNNYTEDELAILGAIGNELPGTIKYIVYGRERGDNGTPHLQGYISFSKRKTLASIRALIGSRGHYEIARGSPKQAADYCKKDGDYSEFGTPPAGQGTRTDLAEVAQTVRDGSTFSQVADQHPASAIRYGNGILRLIQLKRPDRRTQTPELWCFYGKTGTGKTRRVHDWVDHDDLWISSGTQWFCGYDGHKCVLFDDYDGSWFKITYLLKLIDRYVFQVPVKGSMVWWYPDHIYFTSNQHPTEWYPGATQNHQDALLRRFREFGNIEECKEY